MTKRKLGPMNLYPLLPKTNCALCGPRTCMGFAVQLCERSMGLEQCPPLTEPQYEVQLARLQELLAPPVREVLIGRGRRQLRVGGEQVMRRHELRYFNQTGISITVEDRLSEEDLRERVRAAREFHYPYIGATLSLDAVAIRSGNGDPERFQNTVSIVKEEAQGLPMILWSDRPAVIRAGLEVAGGDRPLIYAATPGNWREMGECASSAGCPLAILSPGDIAGARSLAAALKGLGIQDLLLDLGCGFNDDLPSSINTLTMARTSAIAEGDALLGYPLIGTPVTCWDHQAGENDETIRWMESCLATMLIVRYTDLVMIRDATVWSLLPLVVLRANLYNDPRKPVSVEPGLRSFGSPDPVKAPVLITSNFALTYYTVLSDIEAIDCHLLVADTEGLSVDSAVAGRKLNAQKVADIISSSAIEEKVTHRTLILPGLAARLKGDVEDATGWDVIIGPRDSAGIPAFLKERWDGRDHPSGWSYR